MYRDINKDKIKDYDKLYYKNNKDKINEQQKIYREKNSDKIKKKQKMYRDNNKIEIELNKTVDLLLNLKYNDLKNWNFFRLKIKNNIIFENKWVKIS